MKGRGTIIFTMGAIVALLVAVMLMQFRTVEETDMSTLEAMRETELRAEVASWKEKYEEASKQLTETEAKITEYYETMESKDEAANLLQQELTQAKMRLGKEAVYGSGIEITLEDNMETQIDDYDIYRLINELRLAGAEAISVNEIRITSMSDIKSIAPGLIHIDGNPLHSPYIIKAIGDQTYLVSALNQKTYGYMDYVIKSYEKTGYITTREEIIIPAVKKTMKFEYGEEVKQ